MTVSQSATEDGIAGPGNVAVGPSQAAWFSGFVTGDFSLTTAGGAAFEGIAVWEEGDPPTDIDGDPRPPDRRRIRPRRGRRAVMLRAAVGTS